MSDLVYTTQKHKKNGLLDILVAKNCWGNAVDKLIKEVRSIPHSLNFI